MELLASCVVVEEKKATSLVGKSTPGSSKLTTLVATGATAVAGSGALYGSLTISIALGGVGGGLVDGSDGGDGLVLAVVVVAYMTKRMLVASCLTRSSRRISY